MTRSLPSRRYAPLYHVMDVHKAHAIFTGDTIPARFKHFDPVDRQLVSGNSFSRNPGMSVRPTDCFRITVDQEALRRRHRFIILNCRQNLSRRLLHRMKMARAWATGKVPIASLLPPLHSRPPRPQVLLLLPYSVQKSRCRLFLTLCLSAIVTRR